MLSLCLNCDIHLLSLDIDTAGSWGTRLWLEPTTLALLTVELAQSLVGQTVKHLPTMPETWVRSLGQEDPLEKEMATHSSILACRVPWMGELGGLQSVGSQRVRHD